RLALSPYGNYSGGVSVAVGDVNGDGVEDVVTGTGPGAPGGHVKVFDGATGTEIRSFLAFPSYAGGVSVAAGDINDDGKADLIVAATGSAGGHVKVFDGQSNALIRSFLSFPGYTGSIVVAAGDVDGDGKADVIVGAGAGTGGHVKAFSGADSSLLRSFLAFAGFSGSISVAAGDVDGDGRADVLVGAGPGADTHVEVFSGPANTLIRSFDAFDGMGGVRVGAID